MRKENYTHISGPGYVEQMREKLKFADFPLVMYDKKTKSFYSSRTVFNNIASGAARIFTYQQKLTSVFTLKCHFHSNGKIFTYRSDKYPGDLKIQWKRIMDLANKNLNLCYSMQLYDNRRSTPDDILIRWNDGKIEFQHELLPFAQPEPKITDSVIAYCNYLRAQNKIEKLIS